LTERSGQGKTAGPPLAATPSLRRGFTTFTLFWTMFVLNGAAPFGNEQVISLAGPGLAILVLGAMAIVWALPFVLVVSELVSGMPEEGGLYRWYRASLGPFWSFTFTCLDWVSWALDSALYPPLVAAYVLTFFMPHHDPWLRWAVGLIFIWCGAWLNIRGVRVVGRSSAFLAIFQLLPVLAIIALGLPHFRPELLIPLANPAQPLTLSLHYAILFALWHYSGFAGLACASEEIVDAPRAYPRALAIFLPVNVALFLLPLMAGLGAAPDWSAWSAAHFNQVALAVGGAGLAALVTLAAQAGAIGIFNCELLVTSRLAYAMAKDDLLPRALSRLHPRHGTPHVMLLLQAGFFSFMTLFFSFVDILTISLWVAMPSLTMFFLVPILLRLRGREVYGHFRIRGGLPAVVALCLPPVCINIFVLLSGEGRLALTGLAFIAVGPLVYGARRLLRSRRTAGAAVLES
jgi:APA family basic amino acid/polyamine antiporter